MNPDVGGVPLKLVYGSDFAYREADEHLGVHYENVGLRPSFAKGGLSNVWGAAMMPFLESDMEEWPFRLSALAPHYAAVLQLTGLAACRDKLEGSFPLYTSSFTELRPSRQCQQLLERNAAPPGSRWPAPASALADPGWPCGGISRRRTAAASIAGFACTVVPTVTSTRRRIR